MKGLLENGTLLKKAYEKFMKEVTSKYYLTSIELTVLLFLKNSTLDTAGDIAKELYITKSHVSLSVSLLSKKGYLKKIIDEKDKKIVHLKLTNKTEDIFKRLNEKQEKLEEILFKGITKKDKERMEKNLNIFKNNIKEVLEERNI